MTQKLLCDRAIENCRIIYEKTQGFIKLFDRTAPNMLTYNEINNTFRINMYRLLFDFKKKLEDKSYQIKMYYEFVNDKSYDEMQKKRILNKEYSKKDYVKDLRYFIKNEFEPEFNEISSKVEEYKKKINIKNEGTLNESKSMITLYAEIYKQQYDDLYKLKQEIVRFTALFRDKMKTVSPSNRAISFDMVGGLYWRCEESIDEMIRNYQTLEYSIELGDKEDIVKMARFFLKKEYLSEFKAIQHRLATYKLRSAL
jgi:hypothetical protein